MDFQVREPVSPLLTGLLPNTNVMMEVQAAQEYTGQAGESPTASRNFVWNRSIDMKRTWSRKCLVESCLSCAEKTRHSVFSRVSD